MKNTKIIFSKGHWFVVKTKQCSIGHAVIEYIEMPSSTLFNRVKQIILLNVSKTARVEKMKGEVKEYMRSEWEKNCPSQYMKYFDEWFSNITEQQLKCFGVWKKGKMGPFY